MRNGLKNKTPGNLSNYNYTRGTNTLVTGTVTDIMRVEQKKNRKLEKK